MNINPRPFGCSHCGASFTEEEARETGAKQLASQQFNQYQAAAGVWTKVCITLFLLVGSSVIIAGANMLGSSEKSPPELLEWTLFIKWLGIVVAVLVAIGGAFSVYVAREKALTDFAKANPKGARLLKK